jgi:hypothetical protein
MKAQNLNLLPRDILRKILKEQRARKLGPGIRCPWRDCRMLGGMDICRRDIDNKLPRSR